MGNFKTGKISLYTSQRSDAEKTNGLHQRQREDAIGGGQR